MSIRAPASAIVRDDLIPEYFLAQQLGLEFHASTAAKDLARHVAAQILETTNRKPSTLWQGLFRRGIQESEAASEGLNRQQFVQQVKHAVQTAKDGWFGTHKLFIHRAWETWRSETGANLDLPAFKEHLLVALRAGELGLARADFTETLDPADLEQAEIQDGQEVFHFITR